MIHNLFSGMWYLWPPQKQVCWPQIHKSPSVHWFVCKTPQQLKSFILHHSTFLIHHSTFLIHHSTFNLQPSSFIIQPLSFTISRLLSFSAFLFSDMIPSVGRQAILLFPKRRAMNITVSHVEVSSYQS